MNIDPNILNAFLTLMGSVAILGIILFLMKKYTLKFKNKSIENNIEVISKLNLSPKNSLWTVKFQNKVLLLGVSEKSINLISEVSNTFSVDDKTDVKLKSKNQSIVQSNKQTVNTNDDLSFKEFLKSAVFKNN